MLMLNGFTSRNTMQMIEQSKETRNDEKYIRYFLDTEIY